MFTIVESSTTINWAPAIRNSSSVLFVLRRAVVGAAASASATCWLSVIGKLQVSSGRAGGLGVDRREPSELRLDRLMEVGAHHAAGLVGENLDVTGFDAVEHLPDHVCGVALRCLHPGGQVRVDVADIDPDDLHAARG